MFHAVAPRSADTAVSASAGPSTQREMALSARRLKPQGVAILQEHWDRFPDQMPSSAVRKVLTERIKKVPGCEFYKVLNTTGWFDRRLAKLKDALEQQAFLNNLDTRFPSLNAPILEHLSVLLKAQQNPPPEVVRTWATLLASTGATYSDVVAWVRWQQQKAAAQPNPANRLPTPANTITPEPSVSPIFAYAGPHAFYKQDPAQSPVLPPLRVKPYPPEPKLSPAVEERKIEIMKPSSQSFSPSGHSHNHRSLSPRYAGASRSDAKQMRPVPRVATLDAIMHGVADAVASPAAPSEKLPINAAEFNAMFAPYENRLSQLMRALESS
ncbi:hypothetical protein BDZ97DRAFT_1761090 [Flammula alnicola]|nr:hypothetical protein BDZ97DRAFT_1761090 [Flammula alnicola]